MHRELSGSGDRSCADLVDDIGRHRPRGLLARDRSSKAPFRLLEVFGRHGVRYEGTRVERHRSRGERHQFMGRPVRDRSLHSRLPLLRRTDARVSTRARFPRGNGRFDPLHVGPKDLHRRRFGQSRRIRARRRRHLLSARPTLRPVLPDRSRQMRNQILGHEEGEPARMEQVRPESSLLRRASVRNEERDDGGFAGFRGYVDGGDIEGRERGAGGSGVDRERDLRGPGKNDLVPSGCRPGRGSCPPSTSGRHRLLELVRHVEGGLVDPQGGQRVPERTDSTVSPVRVGCLGVCPDIGRARENLPYPRPRLSRHICSDNRSLDRQPAHQTLHKNPIHLVERIRSVSHGGVRGRFGRSIDQHVRHEDHDHGGARFLVVPDRWDECVQEFVRGRRVGRDERHRLEDTRKIRHVQSERIHGIVQRRYRGEEFLVRSDDPVEFLSERGHRHFIRLHHVHGRDIQFPPGDGRLERIPEIATHQRKDPRLHRYGYFRPHDQVGDTEGEASYDVRVRGGGRVQDQSSLAALRTSVSHDDDRILRRISIDHRRDCSLSLRASLLHEKTGGGQFLNFHYDSTRQANL